MGRVIGQEELTEPGGMGPSVPGSEYVFGELVFSDGTVDGLSVGGWVPIRTNRLIHEKKH